MSDLEYKGAEEMSNLEILTMMADTLLERDEKIKTVEQKYSDFFNLHSVPMCIFDANAGGVFLDVNPAFERLLGWKKQELVGTPYTDYILEEYIEETELILDEIIQNDAEGINIINQYKTKKGEIKTLLWNGTSPNSEGITQYLCYDLTDQVERAKNLKIEKEFIDLLSLDSSNLVCIHLDTGEFKLVSKSSGSITGYSPEELEGKHPYEFLHKEDIQRIKRSRKHPRLCGLNGSTVLRFKNKKGNWIWLESVMTESENEKIFKSHSKDISEKIRLRNTLHAREEMYKMIIHNPKSFIQLFDIAGNSIYCSDVMRKFVGYTSEELLYKTPFALLKKEDTKIAQSKLEESIKKQSIQELSTTILNKNGKEISATTRIIPIVNESGFTNYIILSTTTEE